MASRMVIVYEGAKVGTDADIAGEAVRAVVAEAERQTGRFRVASVTLALEAIVLKLDPRAQASEVSDQEAREARVVFGAVIRDALARHSH